MTSSMSKRRARPSAPAPELQGAGRGRRRKPSLLAITGLFLAASCFIMLSPFIWTTMSVTKPTDVAFANPPVFLYQPTHERVRRPVADDVLLRYLVNTIVVAVITTIVALVIGMPAAYALSRFPGWVSAVLLVLALVFRALPRFAVVLPMYDITRLSASTTRRTPWPWP